MALQHLRSSTANKRPTPTSMADGQVALNTAAVSPGVFFKDAGGSLVKVGPVHVGTTAPNVSPAVGGHAGNSVGEQWLDTTGGTYVFKVWDGSAWRSETGTFVDVNGDVMTGALGIIAGTAGAPGLYISGDTNTGIYSPGADQVAISTNGTERMRITSAGDLWVGKTSEASLTPISSKAIIRSSTANALALESSVAGGSVNLDFDGLASNGLQSGPRVRLTQGHVTSWESYFAISLGGGGSLSERMRIDSSGRVGLGTSSPDRLLHVSAADTAYIRLENQDSTGSVDQYVGLIEFEGQDSGGSGVRAQIGGIYEGVSGATALVFGTSADAGSVTERLRINRNGSVGIGTTTPGSKLHVAGETVLGDDGTNGRLTVNTTTSTVGLFATTTGFGAYEDLELRGAATIFKRDGTNESARIDSSGRLLVGTSSARGGWYNTTGTSVSPVIQTDGTSFNTSSLALAHNENAAGEAARILLGKSRGTTSGSFTVVQNNDDLGGITFQGADGTNFVEGAHIKAFVDGTPGADDMPGRLVFSTTADGAASPTERMRITNAGEVLIGTTTPVLSAAGLSTSATAAFASGLRLQDGGSVGWGGNPTIRNNNGSGYLICMNGTTGGVGLLNGGTSWTSLSDENYKTNLEPITEASAKIRSLRSVTGRYIDDDESISRSFLIAQDVEAVLPEAVSTAENGKKLLSYTDTIPLLTAALKETLEKIETLEAKVAALEAQ